MYKIKFNRQDYLDDREFFENDTITVEKELCEFSDDIEDIAQELAYTRYELAVVEKQKKY